MPAVPVSDPVLAARAALDRGDLVAAYDRAAAALANEADGAAYLLVLSLARLGDIATAHDRFAALGLGNATDVDTRSLGARLAKDAAEALAGLARQRQFAVAAEAYAAIYADTGDAFPGINAASLAAVAGDLDDARRRAAALLAAPAPHDDFWAGANRAEALLLLGDEAAAAAALRVAVGRPGATPGARATTLKQLELLANDAGCDTGGTARAVLRPAATAFYCGHMFVADPHAEAVLAARIDTALDDARIAVGFGALACGSDILIAERLLARGGELNIVLPFAADEFAAVSVDPGGAGWRPRFDACMDAAASIRIVSDIRDLGDPQAFHVGSATAMGLSRLRARQLGGEATILAVWDGAAARGVAGTGVDVARWQATGGSATILPPGPVDRELAAAARAPYDGPPRAVMAMVFADVPGFTALAEADIPGFWRDVMGAAATALDAHGGAVRSRNSWGDAIFAVVDDACAAADLALDLQSAMARLGSRFTLRIGVHLGPVFETADPVTGRPTFYGREVSRAARIEPVTPPGQVYVTESFAAALAMDAPGRYRCHYAGQVALAKNYGRFPMYRLSRG